MYVIDFDGNPTLSPEERVAHRPAAYDVAGLLLSLENVGHVVRRYDPHLADADVLAWTEGVQATFLDGYRAVAADLLDETLLGPLVLDQIQRELAYADAHLPRWRHVPEAALRRRGLT
jgi:maltokinase